MKTTTTGAFTTTVSGTTPRPLVAGLPRLPRPTPASPCPGFCFFSSTAAAGTPSRRRPRTSGRGTGGWWTRSLQRPRRPGARPEGQGPPPIIISNSSSNSSRSAPQLLCPRWPRMDDPRRRPVLNRRRQRSDKTMKLSPLKTRSSNQWFAAASTGWRPGSTFSNTHTTKTTIINAISSNIKAHRRAWPPALPFRKTTQFHAPRPLQHRRLRRHHHLLCPSVS